MMNHPFNIKSNKNAAHIDRLNDGQPFQRKQMLEIEFFSVSK